MKRISILVIMLIALSHTNTSFGQTQTSTQTPQKPTPNKVVPPAPTHHKKSASKPTTATDNDPKPGKPGGKVTTTPSQEAGYALSGHQGAPEGSPRPKQ
jgi:hypothetical protein